MPPKAQRIAGIAGQSQLIVGQSPSHQIGPGTVNPADGTNGTGTVNPAEGTNGTGIVNPAEGTNGTGTVNPAEGTSGTGIVNPAEGTNGTGRVNPAEGTNGTGTVNPADGTNGAGALNLLVSQPSTIGTARGEENGKSTDGMGMRGRAMDGDQRSQLGCRAKSLCGVLQPLGLPLHRQLLLPLQCQLLPLLKNP